MKKAKTSNKKIEKKMELPHLGQHCSIKSCNRLDYLPVKCELCSKTFCSDHGYTPDSHSCTEKHKIVDVKVDVCEKCNKRVKNRDGTLHECKKQKRKYRCATDKCKTRILVPFSCGECYQIVCPRHRFPADHNCISTAVNRMRLVDVCG